MSFELFLTEPYFQRILATAVLVAISAALVGVFLVQRGMALLGDGVAHISFAGIALGFVAGWMPLASAIIAAGAGTLAVQALRRRGWVGGDAALGIVYTTSLAFGVVLVSSRGSVPVDIESYLFGNLLLAGETEFYLAAAIAILVTATITVLWRPFVLLSFGEERARVQGLPAAGLNTLFLLVTAVTVVAAVRIVGVLLVSGLLIMPAATASRLASSMKAAALWSVAVAVAAVLAGLAISAEFSLASGATITLTSAGMFLLAASLSAARSAKAARIAGTNR